jgi:ABC-type bacteriocin/lantibiotic exporter with double-glycine peptidase domain
MPKDYPPTTGHQPRENLLAFMLSVIVLAVFGVFMIIVTGGLLLQVLGVVLIGVAFGWVHYRLWGRSLVKQTEGEREEAELRAKIEGEEWNNDPFGPKNE